MFRAGRYATANYALAVHAPHPSISLSLPVPLLSPHLALFFSPSSS